MDQRQGRPAFGPAWWAFTSATAAAGAFYVGWRDHDRHATGLGVVFAIAMLGLMARQGWAKRLCAMGYLVPAGAFTYRLWQEGYQPGWLGAAVGLIVCAWIIWSADLHVEPHSDDEDEDRPATDSGSPETEPLLSLVALLPEAQFLDAAIIARLAGKAWKSFIGTDEEMDGGSCVVGESPHFLLTHAGQSFALHNFDRPYWSDSEAAAAAAPDGRIQQALRRHRAWLSVDCLDRDLDAGERRHIGRLLGRLLAELIDTDCLAIYVPETRTVKLYDGDVPALLRGDDPVAVLSRAPQPAAAPVADDDPRLLAAVAEARRRWPEFVSAFEHRTAEQTFSVKAPLRHGDRTEFVWINVTALEGDAVYGMLANDPVHLPYKLDDRLRVPQSDVTDWLTADRDRLRGGFTLAVLQARR